MLITKSTITIATVACLTILSSPVKAEPTSSPVAIINVRPYGNSNYVYVTTAGSPGLPCTTTFFSVDLSSNGGKGIFSGLLTSLMAGKKVQIEIPDVCGTGSAGSTTIKSLYITN